MIKFIYSLTALVFFYSCNGSTNEQQNTSVQKEDVVQNENQKEVINDLRIYGMQDHSKAKGLEEGETLPDISLITSDSQKINLKDLYSKQPLVVIFYRGYWCPACNQHLSEFAKRAAEVEEAGAKIVAISPESYDNRDKTVEKTGANFMLISDVDGSVMKAFDVDFEVTEEYQEKISKELNASISESNATNSAVLPVPATFIIDTNGSIIYKHFDPDYKNRASIDDILSRLP